jgi:hypothetical protein
VRDSSQVGGYPGLIFMQLVYMSNRDDARSNKRLLLKFKNISQENQMFASRRAYVRYFRRHSHSIIVC